MYNEIYPQYSPNGQMIAYISDESGINNIYVTEDEFLTSTNITNVLTGITQIDWFTNTELVFTGFYKSGYDIFLLSDINKKIESLNISNSAAIVFHHLNFLKKNVD